MVKYKFTEKANTNNVIWVESEGKHEAIYVVHKLTSIELDDVLNKYKIEVE